jgi:hypothetical protein
VRVVSHSERLRAEIDLLYPELRDAVVRLVRSDRIRALYPEYLFVLHCMVRATVPLLVTARTRASELAPDDAVAAGLVDYLDGQIAAEHDHDRWLLEDIESLGVDPDAVLRRPPPAPVAALVGAQYYWVLHAHPVALLGHIAVLEGHPPTQAQADDLMACTGYPASAFRTLAWHAEADEDHQADLYATLDRLPLDATHLTLLAMSAAHSVHAAAAVVDHVHALAR